VRTSGPSGIQAYPETIGKSGEGWGRGCRPPRGMACERWLGIFTPTDPRGGKGCSFRRAVISGVRGQESLHCERVFLKRKKLELETDRKGEDFPLSGNLVEQANTPPPDSALSVRGEGGRDDN